MRQKNRSAPMPATVYNEGSYQDITPEEHEGKENVGLIQWRITTENFEHGGHNCVVDSRNIDIYDDPWIEFNVYYKILDWNGIDKWTLKHASGLYKTKRGYWETHVGYPSGKYNEMCEKGLCTILYETMMEYSLTNGVKTASSEAYATNNDVKKIYTRLDKSFNFKKRGKRVFLRNKKKK